MLQLLVDAVIGARFSPCYAGRFPGTAGPPYPFTKIMRSIPSLLATLCVVVTLSPPSLAQDKDRTPQISDPGGAFPGLRKYTPPVVAPIDLSNSNRLESLLRAGNLYLSLQDVIDLALENNLDIAMARYGPLEAEQDLRRSRAGGALRGVNQNVAQGPSSATGLSLSAFSTTGATVASNATAASSTTGGTGGSVNGIISQLGPTVPNYDPVLTGTISYGHSTALQTSGFLNGQDVVLSRTTLANFGITQGFATGAQATLNFDNTFQYLNTGRLDINPYTSGFLQVLVTQPLLQGFGMSVNNRLIRQAKNSLKIQDAVFKQQVQTTIANAVNLYWDLVSFNEQVKVAQQALATSEKLYNDNKKQVEIGTLAPIAIVQAEAEVATRQQDLTVAQTNVLQQETIVKNALSRQGVASPSISEARIVPLDRIRVPGVEPVQPIQDLVQMALDSRPEVDQSKLNIDNTTISIQGDRNNLLPNLSAFASLNNNALVGSVNPLAPPSISATTGLVSNRIIDPLFSGGYGTYLGQLFGHNFPDYRVGVQLSIPIRNRAAQADYVRDTLNLRQNQLGLQKQVNQIRVDVQNALISLQQARARYQAAVKSRVLEEQTLDAEQKKYALGASTIYNVILIQRDLATVQGNEVTAESNYIKSRNNLDFVTGQILQVNNVELQEAVHGQVSRPPSPIPVIDQNGAGPPGGAKGSK